MHSMTGFGCGTAADEILDITVEIRSVNSRYCDITCKLPRMFSAVEDTIRNAVKQKIARGKVELFLTYKSGQKGRTLQIDSHFIKDIRTALVKEGFYTAESEVPFEAVFAVGSECFAVEEYEVEKETLTALALTATAKALEQMLIMRRREGEILKSDLVNRLDRLTDLVSEVEAHKDAAVRAYEKRLHQRMQEMLETTSLKIGEDRILQEIAIMADKTDISEEIVRFGSHVVQLRNTLNDTEPIGRKLDFLIQEMNREVNTMGSKGADLSITDRVVALKCELEKIREQVQNIE